MEQNHAQSVEGSPRPSNIFEPHMPGVYVLPDMDALFRAARAQLRDEEFVPERGVKGQRVVAVVTPERQVTFELTPPRGSLPDADTEPANRLFPPEPPLNISVVSYTLTEARTQDETRTRCIPFIGHLARLGYVGHSVVVFEGHPTAFESGVRDGDVLIVDAFMLPFIQGDWFRVAQGVMRPGAKVFVYDRWTRNLLRVGPSSKGQGWQYSEHDGEASYVNSLLTTLAKGKGVPALITSGRPLPDLAGLTDDPDELDWVAGMPFKYDELDADEVIEILKRAAGWSWFYSIARSKAFRMLLVVERGESREVSFTLTRSKDAEGTRQFKVERW